MFCNKSMVLFLYFAGTLVYAMESPIITRDTYDLLQFPKCDGKSPENFVCASRSERIGDRRTCQCRCENGFVTYRDPIIEFISTDNVYKSKPGSKGCVFYSHYREGCHFLQRVEEISHNNNSFPTPTILDLTSSGSVRLARQDSFQDNGRLCVQPYVRVPGEDLWKRVTDIDFELKLSEIKTYILSWTVDKDADIYAYQGLVMKLNFSECQQSGVDISCIMTKIAGTFTGGITCRQRTVNGRCCIFPFVHNDVVYNQCATTSDMTGGPWCAVSLDKSIENGTHKWREYCNLPLSLTPSTIVTKPSSRPSPGIDTSPSPTKRSTTRSASPSTKNSQASTSVHPILMTVPQPSIQQEDGEKRDTMNIGVIVAAVLGIVGFFVIILALLALYLRKRKSAGKTPARSTLSNDTYMASQENFAEPQYATVYGSPPNHLNHGFQQPIELTEDYPAAVVGQNYLNSTGNSHFYDTVENQTIYNVPEADYSLILEKHHTKADDALPPVLPVMLSDQSNKHLYSVLERENDPLKHPEPTDNDAVFVEANPLYGLGALPQEHEENPLKNTSSFSATSPLYMTTFDAVGFKRDAPPPVPPRADLELEKGEADV